MKKILLFTQMVDGELVAGRGLYSHAVPQRDGRVVLIRDGNHAGTEVYWSAADWRDPEGDGVYRFVSLDSGTVSSAERCVLVRGQLVDELGPDAVCGCDLETAEGLVLLGVSADDELSWLSEGAEVLWDSHA